MDRVVVSRLDGGWLVAWYLSGVVSGEVGGGDFVWLAEVGDEWSLYVVYIVVFAAASIGADAGGGVVSWHHWNDGLYLVSGHLLQSTSFMVLNLNE